MQEATVGGSRTEDVTSALTGVDFRLFAADCGPDPRATLVVSDGNGLFGLTVDLVRLMRIPGLLPPLRVVGIGYPDAREIVETVPSRTRDLTPTPVAGVASGGGAQWLSFVRDELFPLLAERHGPAALERTVYFGHSLGGLLGVHDALSDRPVFDHHVASSPSLWWDRRWILRERLPALAGGLTGPRDLFVGIGADETDEGRRREAANLPEGHPFRPPATYLDMVDDARRLVRELADLPGVDAELAVIPGEYHATAAPAVLGRGLRHVFEHRAAAARP